MEIGSLLYHNVLSGAYELAFGSSYYDPGAIHRVLDDNCQLCSLSFTCTLIQLHVDGEIYHQS